MAPTGQLPTNSGSNILSAIAQLAPIFVGSGKTTKTSSTGGTTSKSADPAAILALQQLLGSNAANPAAAKDVVGAAQKNAINLMLQQGVPSIGAAERGSGIFNSSQTAQAMSQLEGQTAAAAAKMEVDQMNTAAQTATQASSALGALTPTVTENAKVTETAKTDAAVNPLYSALGLALGVGLANKDSIFNLFGGGDSGTPGKKTANIADIGNAMGSVQSSPILERPINNVLDAFSSASFGNLINNITGDLKANTFDPGTGQQVTGGINELAGAAEGNLVSQGISVVGSILSNLFAGGLFSGGSGEGSKPSIICTRLHELGYMDDETYAADKRFGEMVATVTPDFHAWYLSWAAPFAARLRKGSLLTRVTWAIAKPWAQHMKYAVGASRQDSRIGLAIFYIGALAFTLSKSFQALGAKYGKYSRQSA